MEQGNEDDSSRLGSSKGLIVRPSSSRKKKENAAGNTQLPWDVLDIISKKLDFDDIFQFAGVCKSWWAFHKIYWRNFKESQAPLLVHTSSYAKKALFFINLPDQKFYRSKMNYFWGLAYSGSSSGYLIMTAPIDNLQLMNPFTRRRKVINTLALQGNLFYSTCHALLAFAKGSEEFVIVVTCKSLGGLHVYQSRNSAWVNYSIRGIPWKVVDFVVLNNTIYVITDNANIGALCLKYANIKFLKLKNTPSIICQDIRFVNCDGQLLVVHFSPTKVLDFYKVDFSIMSYVKLKTLGDISLFYALGTNCYALSNPSRWGYSSNSVYYIDCDSAECKVYSGDDNKLQKCIMPEPGRVQASPRSRLFWLDWYFKHLRDEVDYSLVG